VDQPSPRFARVLQTVTIEVQIDLSARKVFQVMVDHTAPLHAWGLAEEDEAWPALSLPDETLALDLAARRLAAIDDEELPHPLLGPAFRPQ